LRIIKGLVVVGAIAATAATLAVAPALAEPINAAGHPVTPAPYDIVGVGSESISYVSDQLSYNYNLTVKKHGPSNPYIYDWDAVPPSNLNNTTQVITLKAGCTKEARPDGSSAGISALTTYPDTHYKGKTYPCVNFARSSRPRKSTDPDYAAGGVAFVTLAQDAVTYSSTAVTNVPNNLTKAQLVEIFSCTVPSANGDAANTWGALLGAKAKKGSAGQKIDPIVPQAGSGTLSFWMETALGLTTDTEPTCGTAASLSTAKQPEENEGTSSVFLSHGKPNPNVIYPFSVGAYVAEAYHSKVCGHAPKAGQNKFGCDETGVLHLDGIAGIAPTVKKSGVPVTNPAWNSTVFRRFLYDVVPFATNTSNHIPTDLEKWFGAKGGASFCKQTKVLEAYGFEPTSLCGFTD
jgi:hypothetical protein